MPHERVPIRELHRTDEEFVEDLARYRFASEYVRGYRVVDIACGTGYGTRLLTDAGSAHVVGVDVAEEALADARSHFSDPRVEFLKSDGVSIPLETGWADAAVSLETLEHVPDPAAFLRELRRVVRAGGVVIVSTPRNETDGRVKPANPFHLREFSEEEFLGLLRSQFEQVELWSQITDYEDDLAVGRWLSDRGAADSLSKVALRPLRRLIPAAVKRHLRRTVGSRGLRPVASRIVKDSDRRAAVQIAVAR